MFRDCSDECLKNAESLIEDAKILVERKKYASAQSLSITALEEAGKAIILELVDLNYYDKNLAKKSIYSHKSKKAIMKAIKNGMILTDQINREPGNAIITQEKMKELGEKFLADMNSLNNNRLKGLYVEIDFDTGKVKSSPRDCTDTSASIEEASKYISLGKFLCDIFRQIKASKNTVNNLRILDSENDDYPAFWKSRSKKPDKTVSISYDES